MGTQDTHLPSKGETESRDRGGSRLPVEEAGRPLASLPRSALSRPDPGLSGLWVPLFTEHPHARHRGQPLPRREGHSEPGGEPMREFPGRL